LATVAALTPAAYPASYPALYPAVKTVAAASGEDMSKARKC
jgi:hypothetical protein